MGNGTPGMGKCVLGFRSPGGVIHATLDEALVAVAGADDEVSVPRVSLTHAHARTPSQSDNDAPAPGAEATAATRDGGDEVRQGRDGHRCSTPFLPPCTPRHTTQEGEAAAAGTSRQGEKKVRGCASRNARKPLRLTPPPGFPHLAGQGQEARVRPL